MQHGWSGWLFNTPIRAQEGLWKGMQIEATFRKRSKKSCVNIPYQLGVDGLDYILSTQMRGGQVKVRRQLYAKGMKTKVTSRKWSRKSSIKHETLVL